MKKVVFLDRDGVINIDKNDYTWKISDFVFTRNLFENLLKLKNNGFEFIVITNQGGISKKLYTKNDVFSLHSHMQQQFEENGVQLLDIYFCPHHNAIEKCLCRKSNSLLLEKAIAKYNISLKHSYFIGDNERDIIAATKAGISGVKINTNDEINNAVRFILQQNAE